MKTRDKKLIAYYAHGFSMREVALHFNITLGRVQQILCAKAPNLIRPVGNTLNNSTGKGWQGRRE